MENEKEFTEWLLKLVEALDYPQVYVDIGKDIVGFYFNRKKKELHFINAKEARKLSKKNRVWKPLGEDWSESLKRN